MIKQVVEWRRKGDKEYGKKLELKFAEREKLDRVRVERDR
jgi:hypothetical protein